MTYSDYLAWKRMKQYRAGCIAYARMFRCALSAERNPVYFAYFAHRPITNYV